MEEVCELPNGATLYRQANAAGGHTYWSDEIGGGVVVWDTVLVAPSTLTAAITEEWRRRITEQREKRRAELAEAAKEEGADG